MKLTILGLPLGNIQDISLRAIKTLKESNVVICEDTRVFNKLWMKLKSDGLVETNFIGKLISLNDYNESFKSEELIKEILAYQGDVVLVSDAGMPLVSDPGYRLVSLAIENDLELEVIPGPTAAMTALAGSGFSGDRVMFVGFLPKKQVKRDRIWEDFKKMTEGVTGIIYESPLRVKETIEEIGKNFGEDTKVVVARELTKEHEEWIRGSVKELKEKISSLRGEVVILFRLN